MGFNFNFFGSDEHRTFSYKPRYYDEEKEALKQKFGHVDGSDKDKPYVPGSHIRGSLRDGNYSRSTKQNRSGKIIGMVGLVLFAVILIYIAKFYSLL